MAKKSGLDHIDPYEFEEVVADIWEAYGWSTSITGGSQDRGIDVIAKKQKPVPITILLQAKAYNQENKIGSSEVREYRVLHEQEDDVDVVVIVSTGYFTSQAESLASDLSVKLVDRDDLGELMDEVDVNFGFKKARSIMKEAITVDGGDPVREAVDIMQSEGHSRLPVMKDGKVIGSLSESDIVHAGEGVGDKPIREIMSSPPPSISEEATIEEVKEKLDSSKAVIVTDEDGMTGFITTSDI